MNKILVLQLEAISQAAAICSQTIRDYPASGRKFADISRFFGNVLFEFEKLAEANAADWPRVFHEDEAGAAPADDEDEDDPGMLN
ncbi:MAG: hypothetical protein ACREQE_09435 [Candidatus Binataceae bacterium]